MLDIKRYKTINRPDTIYNSVKIKTHVANPIEIDYKSDWRGQEEIVFVIDKQKK